MLIGAHVSSAGGIDTAVDRAEDLKLDALQLFTQSPRTWRTTNHADEALDRFCARRAEIGLGSVVCHATYLINLASLDEALYERSIDALVRTTEIATRIEADGVVIHVGSHLGAGLDAVLDRVASGLRHGLAACGDRTRILLENSAGAGGTIGRSLAELETIDNALGSPDALGLCLDSCHLWVSGIDVTSPPVVEALAHEVDSGFGLERLHCLHINDAVAALASNKDRHANIGEGEMGDALGKFLCHPSFRELPAILETPGAKGRGPDAEQVSRLRALAPD